MSERGVSALSNKTSWLYFGKVVALKIENNGHVNKLDMINVIIVSWSTQLNLKSIRFDQLTYCVYYPTEKRNIYIQQIFILNMQYLINEIKIPLYWSIWLSKYSGILKA